MIWKILKSGDGKATDSGGMLLSLEMLSALKYLTAEGGKWVSVVCLGVWKDGGSRLWV